MWGSICMMFIYSLTWCIRTQTVPFANTSVILYDQCFYWSSFCYMPILSTYTRFHTELWYLAILAFSWALPMFTCHFFLQLSLINQRFTKFWIPCLHQRNIDLAWGLNFVDKNLLSNKLYMRGFISRDTFSRIFCY